MGQHFRVTFFFDTIEEADTPEQALNQAEEFFDDAKGVGGMRHRASHSQVRIEKSVTDYRLTTVGGLKIKSQNYIWEEV